MIWIDIKWSFQSTFRIKRFKVDPICVDECKNLNPVLSYEPTAGQDKQFSSGIIWFGLKAEGIVKVGRGQTDVTFLSCCSFINPSRFNPTFTCSGPAGPPGGATKHLLHKPSINGAQQTYIGFIYTILSMLDIFQRKYEHFCNFLLKNLHFGKNICLLGRS